MPSRLERRRGRQGGGLQFAQVCPVLQPAKDLGRPVLKDRAADDVLLRQRPPQVRVVAVVAVVAHHKYAPAQRCGAGSGRKWPHQARPACIAFGLPTTRAHSGEFGPADVAAAVPWLLDNSQEACMPGSNHASASAQHARATQQRCSGRQERSFKNAASSA